MDIKQIQDLIRFVSKSGVNEVSIEQKDFKITIKTNQAPTYVTANVPSAQPVYEQAAPAAISTLRQQLKLRCCTRSRYFKLYHRKIADDRYILPFFNS